MTASHPLRVGTVADAELQGYMRLTEVAPEGLRQTPFDTLGLALARRASRALPPTHTDDSPKRWELRARIAELLFARGAPTGRDEQGQLAYGGTVGRERQAHIVLGLPASGKSSNLCEPLALASSSHIVDSDCAKELLPEFRDGLGAGAVHEESALIARELVLRAAVAGGDNVVLPPVGRTTASIVEQVDLLHEAGYAVHVYLVELPAEEAARRAVARFHETGRLVDPVYVLATGEAPLRTYATLIRERGLASHARLSADIPRGVPPTVSESSSGARTRDELLRTLGDRRGGDDPRAAGSG